jgi:hypothetical protein
MIWVWVLGRANNTKEAAFKTASFNEKQLQSLIIFLGI